MYSTRQSSIEWTFATAYGCHSMHAHHLTKVVLALSTFAMVPAAGGAELRTYRIASDQSRLFHLTGGLADYDVSAQLAGSFDIEIESDGPAVLTRFDVELLDILSEGSTDPGWSDGQSLAEALFANPVGLTGMYHPTAIRLGFFPIVPPDAPLLFDVDGPLTTITVTPGDGRWARLEIRSVPIIALDNPFFTTDSPGFLVQLVPEPSAWSSVFFVATAAMMRARNRRKLSYDPVAAT
jgi:hypothetical protein